MRKDEYLENRFVRQFIFWIEDKLDCENIFVHNFVFIRGRKSWSCESLYSAFENYWWPFITRDPISGQDVSGASFLESISVLKRLTIVLDEALKVNDVNIARDCCLSVLRWGGVLPKNKDKVLQLESNICNYLRRAKNLLNPEQCNTDDLFDEIMMNSGFTKIYSIMIDDFVIYDGRLGAALGFLVRMFCEDTQISWIPDELLFAFGRGRSNVNRRNPSTKQYKFPELLNNPRKHLLSNMKANWLLKGVLENTCSRFNNLEPEIQMRALESALFMIGYDIRS